MGNFLVCSLQAPFRGFMLNKRDFLSKILMFSVQTRSSISVFNLEALRAIYLKARGPGELFPRLSVTGPFVWLSRINRVGSLLWEVFML